MHAQGGHRRGSAQTSFGPIVFERPAESRVCRGPAVCPAQSERAVAAAPSPESDDPADDAEECELVLGREVKLGVGADSFGAHFAEAVKNRNGSGVLLLTDVLGYEDQDTRDFAYRLSCFGYSVLVPDLFRGQPWSDSRPKSEFDAWRATQRPERVAGDIASARAFLRDAVSGYGAGPGESRLALLGFCYGGGRLLETLAADGGREFSTAVFFYGTKFDPSIADSIQVPVLFITGDQDPLSPVDTVEQLKAKVPGSAIRVYAGRGHAFGHHPASMDDDDAAEDAFGEMRKWLHDHLLMGAPGPWAPDP